MFNRLILFVFVCLIKQDSFLIFGINSASADAPSKGNKFYRFINTNLKCARLLWNQNLSSADSCWQTKNYPLIRAQDEKIWFQSEAPNYCVGPGYPIVAIQVPSATDWIQVVDINVPPQNEFSLEKNRWVFFDTSENHHRLKIPFYNEISDYPTFWDNPNWACFRNPWSTTNIEWTAYTFAVKVSGQVITPIRAFRWGYTINESEIEIIAIQPKKIELTSWEYFRRYYEREYPNYFFAPVGREENGGRK